MFPSPLADSNSSEGVSKKSVEDGPVEIRPRSCSRTWDPKSGVELALGRGKLQDLEPITVGQLFKHTVGLNPAGVALRYKEDGEWKDINYLNYYDLVVTAAKAFIKVRIGGKCLISECDSNNCSSVWKSTMVCASLDSTLQNG